MKNILKFLEYLLVFGLIGIILLTLFFILDRHLFNPNIKGISPIDIKHILIYLVLPFTGLILLIKTINKNLELQ